jgi:hypothetical protein
VPSPHWPWPDNMDRGRQTSTSTAHWAIHFANRNAGTFFQDLGRCSAVRTVTYTQLTLPTICSV